MRREWQPEELIDCWTLVDRDWELVANKSGATRLGFALLLKFFELEGRFPAHAGGAAAGGGRVRRRPGEGRRRASSRSTSGRGARSSITARRSAKRPDFGSRRARMRSGWRGGWRRRCARSSSARSASATALLARCREERLEPPGRIARLLGSARRLADERFCAGTVARLDQLAVERLEELVADDEPRSEAAGGGLGLFAELRSDPGPPGLDSLLCEIARLERVRAIGLPADLFSEADEKRVALWRARAAAEHPSWLRAHPREVRLTLLACFCWSRARPRSPTAWSICCSAVVHKMGARADYRVEQELVADLKAVRGKRGILFALARRRGRASRRHGPPGDLPGRR